MDWTLVVGLVLLIGFGFPTDKIKNAALWAAEKAKAAKGYLASDSEAESQGCPWRLTCSLMIVSAIAGRQSVDWEIPQIQIPGLSQLISVATPTGPLVVVIVEESQERHLLTPEQIAMLNSPRVEEWMRQNCVQLDGHPAYREIDHDADMTHEHQVIRDAFNQPRDSKFWLYVSNGHAGYSGPLPANEEELLQICKKYRGNA